MNENRTNGFWSNLISNTLAGIIVTILIGIAPTIWAIMQGGINARVPVWAVLLPIVIAIAWIYALQMRLYSLLPHKAAFSITHATWGNATNSVDVSSKLSSMAISGKLHVDFRYNDVFSDPAKQERKLLTIEYVHDGNVFSISIPEDTVFTLPPILNW